MGIGDRLDRTHWRMLNVAWRVLGLLFVPAALGFIGWGVWLLAHPEAAVLIDGAPHRDLSSKLLFTAFPLPHLALGIYALRRRTYRPDLGDSVWFANPFAARAEDRRGRSWWTGDRKRTAGADAAAPSSLH
jgi:hypothetical protein